jgi:hypothetical protein
MDPITRRMHRECALRSYRQARSLVNLPAAWQPKIECRYDSCVFLVLVAAEAEVITSFVESTRRAVIQPLNR